MNPLKDSISVVHDLRQMATVASAIALLPLDHATEACSKSRGEETLSDCHPYQSCTGIRFLKKSVLRARQTRRQQAPQGRGRGSYAHAESRTRATAIAASILYRFWHSSLGRLACCHAFLVFGPCLGSSPETAAKHPVGVPGAVRSAGPHAMDRRPLIGNPSARAA